MTRCWEPGVQYNAGDVVEFEGAHYRIIQPHKSQSDWTPPVTPALWGRTTTGDHGHGGHHDQHHHPQQQQACQPPSQQHQPTGGHHDQKVEVSHEEKNKHWYDIDDHRKKQLEIGGGLLAGAAAITAGYLAYREHGKNEEEKKAQTWALSSWLRDAEERLNKYQRNGPSGPAQWILNRGKHIPDKAIVVGKEHSWMLYICRAFYEGGIQIGKASDVFKKGAVIGYDREEIHLDTYEILVGDMRGLRWVDTSGHLNVDNLGYKPVEGGREKDGTLLYIACAYYNGAVHPGKCSKKLKAAYIPYDDDEKLVDNYRVLCYA